MSASTTGMAAGRAVAPSSSSVAGCPDQTAECLRNLPVADLVSNFPGAAIPGITDGEVLTESLGTALAGGRFARAPVLNGVTHDEQRVFVTELGLTVTGGTYVPIPEPITAESYERVIAAVLGVSTSRVGVKCT